MLVKIRREWATLCSDLQGHHDECKQGEDDCQLAELGRDRGSVVERTIRTLEGRAHLTDVEVKQVVRRVQSRVVHPCNTKKQYETWVERKPPSL